jgi:nuclease S1
MSNCVGIRNLLLTCALLAWPGTGAWGWGQDGHSIVAEIAQRRLETTAAKQVEQVLGTGHSLASIGSWADDYREKHPETAGWHFVNIPISSNDFDAGTECPHDNCVIAQLDRLKKDIRCAGSEELKLDALRFAVHFVGDVHQPLHTVANERGGNGISVDVLMRGFTCTGRCRPSDTHTNLHAVWDSTLIEKTVWDWGAYVDRLENGWLKTGEEVDSGSPLDWALQTHHEAQTVWALTPSDRVLDDGYFAKVLPILDRQLGRAGIRLARFLNEGYSSSACVGNQ